jgi:hypothetical protein
MDKVETQSRFGHLMHKGKKVMHVDHTAIVDMPDVENLRTFFAMAHKEIAAEPAGSVRLLTSLTPKVSFNSEISALQREFAKDNTPYVTKSAVVGVKPIMRALIATLCFITGRDIRAFETTEEALDWLVE